MSASEQKRLEFLEEKCKELEKLLQEGQRLLNNYADVYTWDDELNEMKAEWDERVNRTVAYDEPKAGGE